MFNNSHSIRISQVTFQMPLYPRGLSSASRSANLSTSWFSKWNANQNKVILALGIFSPCPDERNMLEEGFVPSTAYRSGGTTILYATSAILFNILNGLMNIGLSFPLFPNHTCHFQEYFFPFMEVKVLSSNVNIWFLYALSSLDFLQDLDMVLVDSSISSGPNSFLKPTSS